MESQSARAGFLFAVDAATTKDTLLPTQQSKAVPFARQRPRGSYEPVHHSTIAITVVTLLHMPARVGRAV